MVGYFGDFCIPRIFHIGSDVLHHNHQFDCIVGRSSDRGRPSPTNAKIIKKPQPIMDGAFILLPNYLFAAIIASKSMVEEKLVFSSIST